MKLRATEMKSWYSVFWGGGGVDDDGFRDHAI